LEAFIQLHRRKRESVACVVSTDANDFRDASSRGTADNKYEQVDGFGYEFWLRWHAGLLDETGEPSQRSSCTVGADRSDPARMPGIPRLQQSERFGAADLADDNAVGT
jgi:hypothetical protein